MVIKFLKKIDMLGIKFHFYSGKGLKRNTTFGGFLTILLAILFMVLFVKFENDFFCRKNPSVTMSIENTLSYEYFDLNKEKVLFAFRIEDYDAHFVDVSNILYFKIYYYTTEQNKNGEFHSIIKDEFLPYHICNDSDFYDVNLTKTFGKLYCPELGGKKFGGYWDSNNLYYFEIQVFYCENGEQYSINNSKCTSLDTLRNFLNQDDPKFFALYYPLVEFNPLSYNEPLIRRYKNYYYCLSYRLQRNDDVFLKKTIMNDDKGWFLNDYKNITKWGVDSFKTTYSYFSDEDLTKEGSSSKIYEINLYTTMEKNYYTRYYTKIQNVIAISGSIINIIIYCFQLVSYFFVTNVQKLDIIKNFFDFDKKRKRNLILFHKCNSTPSKNFCTDKKINNKFNSKQQANNKNIISSAFQFISKGIEKNNVINIDNEKPLSKFKIPIKKLSHNILNNNRNLFNNFLNDSSTNKNVNDKSLSEIQMLKEIYNTNLKSQSSHNFNLYDKDINLKNYLIFKLKKITFLLCCFSKNRNYLTLLKIRSYNILDLYFINLIQLNRYLSIVKQFDFIKKIILNEVQNNSLLFLKKINLKNKEDRLNIILNKNTQIENSVISYFRNIIENECISKTDYLIFNNLSDETKNKI